MAFSNASVPTFSPQMLHTICLRKWRIICPECGHVCNETNRKEHIEAAKPTWIDANGTELVNDDDVVLIKNLPLKCAPKPLKMVQKLKTLGWWKVITILSARLKLRIKGFKK